MIWYTLTFIWHRYNEIEEREIKQHGAWLNSMTSQVKKHPEVLYFISTKGQVLRKLVIKFDYFDFS